MNGTNEVTLSGLLAQNAEDKMIGQNQNTQALNFTVAGEIERNGRRIPYFIPVTMIGKAAENAMKRGALNMGTPVVIRGHLDMQSWSDPQGNKHQRIKVKAGQLELLHSPYASQTTQDGKGIRMKGGINSVVMGGNLTRKPELRSTPEGTSVMDIDLAVNRRYQDSAGKWQTAEAIFVTATLWGEDAGIYAPLLDKGSAVSIVGYANNDNWTDKDGQKRSTVKVTVTELMLIEKSTAGQGAAATPSPAVQGQARSSNTPHQRATQSSPPPKPAAPAPDFPPEEEPLPF